MVFDGAFAEKPQHKAYEVEYGVQSNANLVKIQDKEIEQVATILGELLQQGGDPMSYPHPSPALVAYKGFHIPPMQGFHRMIQQLSYDIFDGTKKSCLSDTWRLQTK